MTDEAAGRAENPLDRRLYGPRGWTLPAVALLADHLDGDRWGGTEGFAGVPVDLARRVLALLDEHAAASPVHEVVEEDRSGHELVALAAQLPAATLAGLVVEPGRGDERVEFREVHVPRGDGVEDLAARLGLCAHASDDGSHLVVH